MGARKIDSEKLLEFINAYRQRECLWNINSRDYKNPELRKHSYREMADLFNVSVEEVKTKIHTLRSMFIKEEKRIKKEVNEGAQEQYVTKHFWYDSMKFISHCVHPRRTQFNTNENQVLNLVKNPEKKSRRKKEVSSVISTSVVSSDDISTHSFKLDNTSLENCDEIEVFCQSLASQLRTLPQRDYIEVQLEIQKIVTRKRLELLVQEKLTEHLQPFSLFSSTSTVPKQELEIFDSDKQIMNLERYNAFLKFKTLFHNFLANNI